MMYCRLREAPIPRFISSPLIDVVIPGSGNKLWVINLRFLFLFNCFYNRFYWLDRKAKRFVRQALSLKMTRNKVWLRFKIFTPICFDFSSISQTWRTCLFYSSFLNTGLWCIRPIIIKCHCDAKSLRLDLTRGCNHIAALCMLRKIPRWKEFTAGHPCQSDSCY